jgi:hypothetical protein
MVKEMAPTPPPAPAVLNNSLTLSILSQLNTSSQLCATSSVGPAPSSAVQHSHSNPNCSTPNIMDLPNGNSYTPVVTAISNTMGTSTNSNATTGQMNYADVNRDLTACRLGYESQNSALTSQQRL